VGIAPTPELFDPPEDTTEVVAKTIVDSGGGGGTRNTHHAPKAMQSTPPAVLTMRLMPHHWTNWRSRAYTTYMCTNLEQLCSEFLAMTRGSWITHTHSFQDREIRSASVIVELHFRQQIG
jgi:hypothetical protein